MNLIQRIAPHIGSAVAAIVTYVLLLVHTELEPWAVLLIGLITYLVGLAVVVRTTASDHAYALPGGRRRPVRARG